MLNSHDSFITKPPYEVDLFEEMIGTLNRQANKGGLQL